MAATSLINEAVLILSGALYYDVSYLNATQPTPVPTSATTTLFPVSGSTTTRFPVSGSTTSSSGQGSTATKPTPDTAKLCDDYECKNDGVCIVEDEKPICRCKITSDWWYVGKRCEKKVSSQDTVVIAVSSSVTIFVVMLIITLVSVYCLKKKHKKKMSKTGDANIMENKSVF